MKSIFHPSFPRTTIIDGKRPDSKYDSSATRYSAMAVRHQYIQKSNVTSKVVLVVFYLMFLSKSITEWLKNLVKVSLVILQQYEQYRHIKKLEMEKYFLLGMLYLGSKFLTSYWKNSHHATATVISIHCLLFLSHRCNYRELQPCSVKSFAYL